MRTLARGIIHSASLIAILALVAAQPAAARVASVHVARVSSTNVVFKMQKLNPATVRSAAVRVAHKKRHIALSKVKRAARSGRLKVRLPRTWKRALRHHKPRLVVRTAAEPRSSQPAPRPRPALASRKPAPRPVTPRKPTHPAPPAQPSAPTAPAPPAPSEPPAPSAPAPSPSISGRTFYVSSSGSDSNPGTSPQSPWRTVGRVNRASLSPGDGVLFQGGATFSDNTLMPEASGTSSAPLVFGSYGSGQPTFTQGAWFSGKSWLTFDDLKFTTSTQGVAGSGGGSGSDHITIQNSSFADVSVAIIAGNTDDSDWTMRSNHIDGTGDSGLILNGDGHEVSDNAILHTGRDSSIAYGKHGIYLKSTNSRITGNTISGFQGNGVSVRYRNSVVEHNDISDGQIGIAWFQYDPQPGTSYWRDNTISGTTAACIYVSPSDVGGATRESFVISGNRLSRKTGGYMDLKPTTGVYTLVSNLNL